MMLKRYSVIGSYCTKFGNLRTFELFEKAETHADAMNQSAERVRRDGRRGYAGKLDLRCCVVSPSVIDLLV